MHVRRDAVGNSALSCRECAAARERNRNDAQTGIMDSKKPQSLWQVDVRIVEQFPTSLPDYRLWGRRLQVRFSGRASRPAASRSGISDTVSGAQAEPA